MWLQFVFYHDLLQKSKNTPIAIVSFTRVIVIHGSRSRALPLPLGNPPGASPWTPLVATRRQAKEPRSFCLARAYLFQHGQALPYGVSFTFVHLLLDYAFTYWLNFYVFVFFLYFFLHNINIYPIFLYVKNI